MKLLSRADKGATPARNERHLEKVRACSEDKITEVDLLVLVETNVAEGY